MLISRICPVFGRIALLQCVCHACWLHRVIRDTRRLGLEDAVPGTATSDRRGGSLGSGVGNGSGMW